MNRSPSDTALFLAQEVRRRRTVKGMTQAELAAKAGVTVETIARLERVLRDKPSANANPSLETMEAIAFSLGCEVTALLKHERGQGHDPILTMIRLAAPDTRRRIALIVEALLRDDKRQRKAG